MASISRTLSLPWWCSSLASLGSQRPRKAPLTPRKPSAPSPTSFVSLIASAALTLRQRLEQRRCQCQGEPLSKTWTSPTQVGQTCRCAATTASSSNRACMWGWSGPAAPASPPRSSCSSGSTTLTRARSCAAGWTCATSTSVGSMTRSASLGKSPCSSGAPSETTLRSDARAKCQIGRLRPLPSKQTPTASSPSSRRGTPRTLALLEGA
mmetsp:Transcript_29454/g.85868  ORF Transcript_29454/g.85868 Transcript_29454/m.85868 type:complete len:209 (+) Transcript_29454:3115-3741(+)